MLTLQEKKDIVPDSSELQIDIEEKSEELRKYDKPSSRTNLIVYLIKFELSSLNMKLR